MLLQTQLGHQRHDAQSVKYLDNVNLLVQALRGLLVPVQSLDAQIEPLAALGEAAAYGLEDID